MGDALKFWSGFEEGGISLYVWTVIVAGAFVLIALCLSSFLLYKHLISYTKPEEQKWLVAVIFMVPVYSFESFVSLWNPKLAVPCGIFRDCYEAFALYAFFSYLIACLGGEDQTVEFLENQVSDGPRTKLLVQHGRDIQVKHPAPFNLCLQPWTLQGSFYSTIKFGIVQYMILKTFCALLALVLELFHVYGEGQFKWYYGYPYITVVMNFSQTWALYCLVQFYAVTHCRLCEINPLAKFVCFKSIVFATWWQGVLIAVIFGSRAINTTVKNKEKLQTYLQDLLICIEMAIAAVAHIYVFAAMPYQNPDRHRNERISFSADYESWNSELGLEEGKESEDPAKVPYLPSDIGNVASSLKASVQDVVFVGGEQVLHDIKLTISQAVKPVEKGIDHLHDKLHEIRQKRHKERKRKKKHCKDDSVLSSTTSSKMPLKRQADEVPFRSTGLLNTEINYLLLGNISDSIVHMRRKPRTSNESDSDSSDW